MIVDVGDGRAVTSLPESVWAVAEYRERSQREHKRSAAWLRVPKLVCLAMLLVKIVFWTGSAPFDLAVRLTLVIAATLLAWSVAAPNRYGATALFAAIAFLFNPFIPVLTFSGTPEFLLVTAVAVAFALSLTPRRTRIMRR